MRTVHDLEAAFADLADTAPAIDMVSIPTSAPAGRRPGARLRGLAPAGAALAVVAVVGGIVFATSGSDSTQQPSGSGRHGLPVLKAPKSDGSPGLTFRFTATPPAGSHAAASYGMDRAGQVLSFGSASVTLHYVNPPADRDEATFNTDKIVDRHPVQVNGHDGFYGRIPGYGLPGPGRPDPRGDEELYWQYAPGAWAEVHAAGRAAELALARSVRAASIAVQVPVDPSATLDGQYLNILSATPSRERGDFEMTTRGGDNGGYVLTWGQADASAGTVGTSGGLPAPGGGGKVKDGLSKPHDVTINGRVWTIRDGDQPEATLKGSPVPISVSADFGRSVAELERVLKGLHIASDLTDRSTWFDAATALP